MASSQRSDRESEVLCCSDTQATWTQLTSTDRCSGTDEIMQQDLTSASDDITVPKTLSRTDSGALSSGGPLVVNLPHHSNGDLNIGGEVNTTHNYNELHQHIECHGPIQCRRLVQHNTVIYNNHCFGSNHTTRDNSNEGSGEATFNAQPFWFIQTDSLEKAACLLEKQHRVVLCGPAGSGKTTLGKALLCLYSQRGLKSYSVTNVHELNLRIGERGEVAVLMDGVLGEVRINTREYEKLRAVTGSVSEFTKAHLIFTMYPHILREINSTDSISSRSLMKPADVVEIQENPINDEHKKAMLEGHLQELNLAMSKQDALVKEILQKDVSGAAFPWCCSQMVDKWQSLADPTVFFTAPSEAHVLLLRRMLRHHVHGEALAAMMSLKLLGVGGFLHNPRHVQLQLETLGFRNFSCDCLEEYADNLKGSILNSDGRGFHSREMYDAVGLALGRSFRLPILLKVCDVEFLVQHVRTQETATEFSVTIGPSPDDRQLLMQTMYDHMVRGRLPELCQHPSLHCPQFLQEFEAFCQRENYIRRLLRATDTTYEMPLLYWSVWGPTGHLTDWCLKLIKEDTDNSVSWYNIIIAGTAIACLLIDHTREDTPRMKIVTEAQRFEKAIGDVHFPLPSKHTCITAELQATRAKVVELLKSRSVCVSDGNSLSIALSMIASGVETIDDGENVNVVLAGEQWYLVLRLLTERRKWK